MDAGRFDVRSTYPLIADLQESLWRLGSAAIIFMKENNPKKNGILGDRAWQAREARRRRREWCWQALAIVATIALLWIFAYNIFENLQARDIRSGFAFLSDRASFEIGESLIAVSSNDSFARMFFAGMLNTVRVAVVAIITATILGVLVGLMRLSKHPLLRLLGVAHVEFYRNIPLLIQLFAIYLIITEFLPDSFAPWHLGSWVMLSKGGFLFSVPLALWEANISAVVAALVSGYLVRSRLIRQTTALVANIKALLIGVLIGGVVWVSFGILGGWSQPHQEGFLVTGGASLTPEFITLWIGLTTFTSAAIAEIVRAGILAVPINQWNAAKALGMTRSQTVSYVVMPQSLKLIVPPLASQYMNLTKNSSLAVIIGYPDIVSVGNTSIVIMGQALEAIVIIMSVYLLLNLLIAVIMSRINSRVTATSE